MIRIGTAHYRSRCDAQNAYGDGFDAAVKEGRILIGQPTLGVGEKLLVDAAGRYHIETPLPKEKS